MLTQPLNTISVEFDGRGGEGRRIALLWWQKQKRERELPESSKQYANLMPELKAAIAKAAGVPDDIPLKDLLPHQRWALRRAADALAQSLLKKSMKAKSAAVILAKSCTIDEPPKG